MTKLIPHNLIPWFAAMALALFACSKSGPTSSAKPDDNDDDKAAHQGEAADEPGEADEPGGADDPARPGYLGGDDKRRKMRSKSKDDGSDPAMDRMSTESAINVEDEEYVEDEDEEEKGVGKAIMMDE